jgi:trehalose-6-phosphate synthase
LEHYPRFRDKTVLTQIVTPSRYELEEYHAMKKEIDEGVGQINSKYRTEEWTPIHYFYRRIPQVLLLAYYMAADIGLLTPLRDGMNLIAKEYIATKKTPGVLILSEFAGASEELNEAIIVNPYDMKETGEAIRTAVEIPVEEKKHRFQAMKEKVRTHDSHWWMNQFMRTWKESYA